MAPSRGPLTVVRKYGAFQPRSCWYHYCVVYSTHALVGPRRQIGILCIQLGADTQPLLAAVRPHPITMRAELNMDGEADGHLDVPTGSRKFRSLKSSFGNKSARAHNDESVLNTLISNVPTHTIICPD